jgi:hypothetical protein
MAGARGSARRQLVARLYGARNRRRAPGESVRLRAVARWLPAALIVAGIPLAAPRLLAAVRDHEYFAVREIAVRPTHRLSPADLRRLAGIEPGTSIWDVDPTAVAARLTAEPWVHAATVERQLPARVVIRVREARPAGILALRETGLWYVARDGHVIAPVAARDSHDFAFITGLAAADLGPGTGFGSYALRRALAALRAAAGVRGLAPVSEVHVDRARGLSLLLLRPAVPVELGWDGFRPRLALLPRVLALWAGQEAEMTGVSVRFGDQVVVRTRAAAGTNPPLAQKVGRS